MSRVVQGVLVATVVMYVWGFVYWGVSPLPYQTWKQAPDDEAAGVALLEHFPESGVYYVPGSAHPAPERTRLFEQGPTGFVIIDRDGRPAFDLGVMASGLVLNAIVASVLALLLQVTLSGAPEYVQRLRIATYAGVAVVLLVNFGDVVWWAMPLPWVMAQAIYNLVAVVLAGAVLARFVRP